MADSTPKKSSSKASDPEPKTKSKAKTINADDARAGDLIAKPAGQHRRRVLLRRACCALAAVTATGAVAILALSLTVLKVRDPSLTMSSLAVDRFRVSFLPQLRINATLSAALLIGNPNYESMRFGASTTEIFLLDAHADADGVVVGVGSAPPGLASARGESEVRAAVDVFVDRVLAPEVVREVLLGGRGEVRLASRTAVDGRISVLGGLYGRRTVRVAMRCRVVLRVSLAAVVVADGSPSCVAEFGR
ncbi:uncharacterized protein LOC100837247 [Brachypodium distachyon]|uniref:Late embryogenesis abundant protein LEA-2 subgroup domain-containing protein n=1 Tax=Brachypodium distachyon TaxID=15368 RepID=I1HG23_BRADI|nr:uncharacterized protein LOC100837247 [Brachypodium distachyon]KQK04708.1 hypothetical protein BRADI_2g15420v3 [Brachypodium distachyon]|eukprot:XP_003565855.1 uncharacterized protein LOC100837247 [Brachypodium distachyon]